nr:transposase [Nocardia australiensis]
MDPETGSHHYRCLTSGKGAWSARCAETRTAGAAGGPGKRAGCKASTAPRSDPTILRLADDEPYRREAKAQANLQEGRHDLARRIFHGRKGELTRAYLDGMEDQLSALGLVLNCVVLWNTVYMNRALQQLRAQQYTVLDEDAGRLSPFVREHIGLDGHYAFHLPDLGGTHRPLRNPDAADDEKAAKLVIARTTTKLPRPAVMAGVISGAMLLGVVRAEGNGGNTVRKVVAQPTLFFCGQRGEHLPFYGPHGHAGGVQLFLPGACQLGGQHPAVRGLLGSSDQAAVL